jgi:hypothetical protein
MTKLEGITNDQMTDDRDDASSSFVIRHSWDAIGLGVIPNCAKRNA